MSQRGGDGGGGGVKQKYRVEGVWVSSVTMQFSYFNTHVAFICDVHVVLLYKQLNGTSRINKT